MYFYACPRFNNALSHSKIRFLSVKFPRCQVTAEFCQIQSVAVLFCRVPHFPAVFFGCTCILQGGVTRVYKGQFFPGRVRTVESLLG